MSVVLATLAFAPPAASPSRQAELLAAGPELGVTIAGSASRVGPTATAPGDDIEREATARIEARVRREAEAKREASDRARRVAEARPRVIRGQPIRGLRSRIAAVSAEIAADANAKLIAAAEAKLAADAEAKLAAEATARAQAEAKAREAIAKERARNGWSSELEADVANKPASSPVADAAAPNVLYRALLVTVPDGADVYVNNNLLGKSPTTVHWQPGSVSHVSVKLAGHDDAGFDLTDRPSAKLLKLELVGRESKVASPL